MTNIISAPYESTDIQTARLALALSPVRVSELLNSENPVDVLYDILENECPCESILKTTAKNECPELLIIQLENHTPLSPETIVSFLACLKLEQIVEFSNNAESIRLYIDHENEQTKKCNLPPLPYFTDTQYVQISNHCKTFHELFAMYA